MNKNLYSSRQLILLFSLILFIQQQVSAQAQVRVWGGTQSTDGGSIFYLNGTSLSRSLTLDSLSKVGIIPAFLMQARNGYVYGVSSSATASNADGVLFRINEKGAAKICTLPQPLGKSTKIVEGNDGYFYGIGQSASGTNSTVFKVKSDGSGFQSRKIATYAFHGRGGLTLTTSGKIIGMSESGGNNGNGFIYELLPDISNIRIIYDFEKSGGKRPFGAIVESGGSLYGQTNSGGQYNYGAIFRVQEDGQNYTALHHFNLPNGAYPMGGLVIMDGMAYGMTNKGGAYKKGTVFKIKLDGTSFTILKSFNGSEGEFPEGDFINTGSTLTGVAGGGPTGAGVIFKLNTDGSGFSILHSFNRETPLATLLLVKESWKPLIALTTPLPGATGAAVQGIFRSRAELESRNYTLQFSEDASFKTGVRTISSTIPEYNLGNSFLKFSTTYYGRVAGGVWPVYGPTTSFKTRSAADYTYITQPVDQSTGVVASQLKITVNLVPGANRYLIQLSTTADFSSGVLKDSSAKDGQRIFTISRLSYAKKYYVRAKSDLSSFGKITSFTTMPEPVVKVSLPQGDAAVDPSMFAIECSQIQGATKYTVQISVTSDFSAPMSRASTAPGQFSFVFKDVEHDSHYYVRATSDRSTRFGPVAEFTTRSAAAQKRLWGMTTRGGNFNLGTIFSYSLDSGTLTSHHNYYNENNFIALTGSLSQIPSGLAGLSVADGTGGGEVFSFTRDGVKLLEDYGPHQGSIMLGSDNYLYILDDWINLFRGGVYRIFSEGDSVGVFDRIIFRFSADEQGINPAARLLEHTDGYLYGCTPAQGQFDKGTLFRLRMDGSSFQVIHHFNGADGAGANTELVAAADGYLYGVTNAGGTSNQGVIYKVRPDGTGYKVIHQFNGTTGSKPEGAIAVLNNKLFGTTSTGGSSDRGVIFSLTTDGSSYTTLLNCDGATSGNPRGELTIDGSTIFGMTSTGGQSNLGVLFKMNLNGTGFQPLFDFTAESGGAPDGGLLLLEDTFYPAAPATRTMEQTVSRESINVYPNPFTDSFSAEIPDGGEAIFVVKNLSGAVLMNTTSTSDHFDSMGSQLEKGIYVLTVTQGEKTSTHRIVKK